jgi:hypothetical protein
VYKGTAVGVKVYLLGPLRLTTSHVMWKGLRDMSVTRDTQPARHRSQAAKVQAVHMCVTVRSANFAANQYSTVQLYPALPCTVLFGFRRPGTPRWIRLIGPDQLLASQISR